MKQTLSKKTTQIMICALGLLTLSGVTLAKTTATANSTAAETVVVPGPEQRAQEASQRVYALLQSPIDKMKMCAEVKGVLPYQTALSANYFMGRKGLVNDKDSSQVMGYAWALIVDRRIRALNNPRITKAHENSLKMLAKGMTPKQLIAAQQMSNSLWKKYAAKWGKAEVPASIPPGCEITA